MEEKIDVIAHVIADISKSVYSYYKTIEHSYEYVFHFLNKFKR
jgi:hypothetical protein